MKLVSRADVLRCLKANQPEIQPLSEALGFVWQPAPITAVHEIEETQKFPAKTVEETEAEIVEQARLETVEQTGSGTVGQTKAGKVEQDEPGDPITAQQRVPVEYLRQTPTTFWYVAAVAKHDTSEDELPLVASKDQANPPKIEQRQKVERHVSLRTAGQWLNLWDQALPQQFQGKALDLVKTQRLISRAQPLTKLPRMQQQSFNRHVTLLLEHSAALRPIWQDMREAEASLRQLIGCKQLDIYTLGASPHGDCYHKQGDGCFHSASLDDIRHETCVIAIGCFGDLTSHALAPDWLVLFTHLVKHAQDMVLMPVRSIRHPRFRIIPLEPLHKSATTAQQKPEEILMACLSQFFAPSLSLLRKLCQHISASHLLTELLVYNNTDQLARFDTRMQLHEDVMFVQGEKFLKLPAKLQQAVESLRKQWRRYQNSLEQELTLLQIATQQTDEPDLERLPVILYQAGKIQPDDSPADTWAFAHIHTMLPLIRLQVQRHGEQTMRQLNQAGQLVAKQTGSLLPLGHKGLKQTGMHQTLYQSRGRLRLIPQTQTKHMALLTLSKEPYCVQTGSLLNDELLKDQTQIDITDNGQQYSLQSISKPSWAECIWQDQDGLHAAHEGGSVYRLMPASQENSEAYWQWIDNVWAWAEDTGIDQYGLWAECQVKNIVFRLRWITAGSFIMGSPEDEKGRYDGETQHAVTLTQGFWLGETTVTQALWQAVMDNNPAEFKNNPENPVEQVSWDDCQEFMQKLQKALPGLQINLPTEAQWEYACRAGTKSAFNWGDDELNINKANYHATSDLDDEREGEFRKITLPAKHFQPNAWGLYQMHGNVWEWCVDWHDDYLADSVIDSVEPRRGHKRVLRGGSWFDLGLYLRSAYRGAFPPGKSDGSTSLRLAGGLDFQAGREALCVDRRPHL